MSNITENSTTETCYVVNYHLYKHEIAKDNIIYIRMRKSIGANKDKDTYRDCFKIIDSSNWNCNLC